MAGFYQNNSSKYLSAIKKWLDKNIEQHLWDKSYDIHLDEIDKRFKDEKYWVDGSLFILSLFAEVVDASKYKLLLVIPLSWTEESTDICLLNKEFVNNHLDTTPPSVYLFPLEHKNLQNTLSGASAIKDSGFSSNLKVWFKEHEERGEYFGFILISF